MRNLPVAVLQSFGMAANVANALLANAHGRFVQNAEAEDRNAEHLHLFASISCMSVYRLLVRRDENRFQLVHTNCATSAMLLMKDCHGLRYLLVRSSPLRMPLCAAWREVFTRGSLCLFARLQEKMQS